MIETVILNYLKENMDVPVYMEIPKNPETRFITLEKTGGGIVNHIGKATFAIQSHAESLFEAAFLNVRMINVMLDSIILDEITHCSLNSDYNYTDGNTKDYRYQAVFDLTHYEV